MNQNGLVTGIFPGTCIIRVTSNDFTHQGTNLYDESYCEVLPNKVTNLTIAPASVTLNMTQTQQLTPTISPSNATYQGVAYSSSNAAVASVSPSGLITANYSGSATITATATGGTGDPAGQSATTSVTVRVISVAVTPTTSTITINTSRTYTGTTTNATNTAVTWSVSGGGTITQLTNTTARFDAPATAGTSTITATSVQDPARSGSITVTRTVPVTGVTVSPTSASMDIGQSTQFTATIAPSNATNQSVSWATGNTSIASVTSNGLVIGVAAGSTTVTATANDTYNGTISQSRNVTITNPEVPATSIQAYANDTNIGTNSSTGLYITRTPPNATGNLSWSLQSGSGSVSGSTYYSPSTNTTAVVRATLTGLVSAQTRTSDVTIYVTAPPPTCICPTATYMSVS